MASYQTARSIRQFQSPGRFSLESPVAFVVGVLLSVGLHAALLFLDGFDLQTETILPEQSERFVDVGIYKKPPAEPKRKNETRNTVENPIKSNNRLARFSSPDKKSTQRSEVPDKPPVEMNLPGLGKKTIGPGAAVPSFTPGNNGQFVGPSAIQNKIAGTNSKLGAGDNSARFFNIADQGKRIVYALDRSGSMVHNNALEEAKQQLVASLNDLSDQQQFQVIFYDENPYTITLGSDRSKSMFYATSDNVAHMKSRVAALREKGGTEHMKALRAAFQQKPDIIFFLTDANSTLNARQLNEIRIYSRKSKTRIHCIEFGKGPDLTGAENFLKQIAAMTGGKYVYRDIQKFRNR